MTTTSQATSYEQTLHAALELSKNSWLLAIQIPGRDNPSLHPITGGDTDLAHERPYKTKAPNFLCGWLPRCKDF